MKACHSAILVILMAVCCRAQDPTLACDNDALRNLPGDSTAVDLISRGEQCAIAAAGNSKDPKYIPDLKKLKKSNRELSGDYHANSAEVAQMALAKLGVEEDLFEIEWD